MKNVINDDGTELVPTGGIDFTYNVISHLKKLLPKFDDYLFILFNHNGTTLPISRNFWHCKKILFWEAGENKQQQFGKVKSDYLCIFTHYASSRPNVYSIPLGYFTSEVSGETIEMPERLFDISFTGCLNRNRARLASLLSGKKVQWIADGLEKRKKKTLVTLNRIIKWEHNNDYFYFTEDFNVGLNKERYSLVLRNSRIVLCPRGWVNAETFRMYEAMKFGCVVITEKLPERDFYRNVPVFQIENWKEGLEVARYMAKHPERLVELGSSSQRFYEEHYQPRAVAKNISLIIKSL